MTKGDHLPVEFHRAMAAVYDNALQKCGYKAALFRMMVERYGGAETAK